MVPLPSEAQPLGQEGLVSAVTACGRPGDQGLCSDCVWAPRRPGRASQSLSSFTSFAGSQPLHGVSAQRKPSVSIALASRPLSSIVLVSAGKNLPGGGAAVSLTRFCSQSRCGVQKAKGEVLVGEPVPGGSGGDAAEGPGWGSRWNDPSPCTFRSELPPRARAHWWAWGLVQEPFQSRQGLWQPQETWLPWRWGWGLATRPGVSQGAR